MKIKILACWLLVFVQNIYAGDIIELLEDANSAADNLVILCSGVAIPPKAPPVVDTSLLKDIASLEKKNDSFGTLPMIPVPAGGQDLNIHHYKVQYPIIASSAPAKIESSHAYPGHHVVELPVLQQSRGSWMGDPVNIGQVGGVNKTYTMDSLRLADGLNCGYHALKNVIYMLAACKKLDQGSSVEAQNLLFRMQDTKSFTQLLSPWLQFVIPYRYQNDQELYNRYPLGNFPSGNELEQLLGEGARKPIIPKELEMLFAEGLHANILILDSFSYLKNPTDRYLKFLERIVNDEEGLYGFVVNDAANKDLSEARGSHWFGYVLWKHANKTKTWLYTDSSYSRHDQITGELIRICSQTPAEFNDFVAKRDQDILDVSLKSIEDKVDLLQSSADVYVFKYACYKKIELKNFDRFALNDFEKYHTAIDVDLFTGMLKSQLNALRRVPTGVRDWHFYFWQKGNDWKITYLDKKKSYENYVYFERRDDGGNIVEDITILSDIPDAIFNSLVNDPLYTTKWNDAIVNRVIQVMYHAMLYMVDHKADFASQYYTIKDRSVLIFDKIRQDVGLAFDAQIDICEDTLAKLKKK